MLKTSLGTLASVATVPSRCCVARPLECYETDPWQNGSASFLQGSCPLGQHTEDCTRDPRSKRTKEPNLWSWGLVKTQILCGLAQSGTCNVHSPVGYTCFNFVSSCLPASTAPPHSQNSAGSDIQQKVSRHEARLDTISACDTLTKFHLPIGMGKVGMLGFFLLSHSS